MNKVQFEYAVIRLMMNIERGELVNVGVVVYSRSRDFLAVRTHVDERKVRILDPDADLADIETALAGWAATCDNEDRMSLGERFRWLTSPRSTMVQAGPVHSGVTDDPAGELDRLFQRLAG
jgi:hypothetical protein